MIVNIKYLGIPTVTCDTRTITFKYQKAEAVFYYIAFHQATDRFRVMALFWPDEPEENARKNLRNALYSIRQAFGFPVFENQGQRMIMLTKQATFITDLESCTESKQDFLQDFAIKDAPAFDDWLALTREELREQSAATLKSSIRSALENGDDPEPYYRRLIKLDPYDEDTIRSLMLYYKQNNQLSRSIELYNQLETLLDTELSLQPEPETVQLFKRILDKRRTVHKSTAKEAIQFIGRGKEMAQLNQARQNVLEQTKPSLLLISGEAGVGKTTLLKKFSEVSEGLGNQVVVTVCHEGDENHRLSAWHPIVVKLGEILEQQKIQPEDVYTDILARAFPPFMHQTISGAPVPIERQDPLYFSALQRGVIALISLVRRLGPLMLFFEDVQWLDEWSLALLCRLAASSGPGSDILYVSTIRTSNSEAFWHVTSEFKRLEHFEHMELQRFTEDEAQLFTRAYLGNLPLDSQTQSAIYNESEGNALYLIEILKCLQDQKSFKELPQKMRQIYRARFSHLNEEARKLADLLSIFPEMITWEDIKVLTGKDDLMLLDLVESLIQGDIIREVPLEDHEIRYTFSHQKLKEFIYESQSATKRRLLHKRIGDYFREQLSGTPSDRLIYPKLIYHYERSGEKRFLLQYRILNLFDYLELSHELFPRIRDQDLLKMHSRQDFNPTFIEREIERIDQLMKAVPEADIQGLIQIEYLNMISRYHLIKGDSELGYTLTQTMISLAEKDNRLDFVYKGYLQLIFHCINLRQIEQMETYLNQAFLIFRNHADKGELGVLIRLKGYLMILMNRFKYGEELLMNAADIFNRPEYREPYALNLVASYYYLGESRRLQNDAIGAVNWYLKAESICRDQGFISHLPLILCGKGTAYYDAGQTEAAYDNLREAVDFYDHLDFKWGQVPAYAYWALIHCRKGQDLICLEYLKKADELTNIIGRAYETGLMLRVKAELCSLSRQNTYSKTLRRYLDFDANSYCKAAISYFSDNQSFTYEKKVLNDIYSICGECCNFN